MRYAQLRPTDLFESIGDDAPLMVAEFIAHDSRLQFWSSNRVQGDAINSKRPEAVK